MVAHFPEHAESHSCSHWPMYKSGVIRHATHTHISLTSDLTLMLLSPTIPGKYLVPSRARESLDVWSKAVTASTENIGFRTNYSEKNHSMCMHGSLLTRYHPTLISSNDGSMIW